MLAPVAVGQDGQTYNVNADTFAGAIAGAMMAKRLLLLTDVPGVLDKNKNLIPEMTIDDCRRLIADGTITDGMIPKIETCIYALERGVEAVVILDGKVPHAVLLELFTDHGAGTLIRALPEAFQIVTRFVSVYWDGGASMAPLSSLDIHESLSGPDPHLPPVRIPASSPMWTPGSSTSTTRSIRTPPASGRRWTSASRSTSPICSASTGCRRGRLQKYFYHKYGTTLRALIDEYDIDPYDFLDFAHDIDHAIIELNASLGEAIERLPGRKLILTNGSRKHAENVARKIGILDHFEDIFDIAASNFVPKPDRRAYETFLDKHGVEPARSAMFEDIAKNLVVPHELGMTTTLIVPQTIDPFREEFEQEAVRTPHIDYVTDDLADFLKECVARGRVRNAIATSERCRLQLR